MIMRFGRHEFNPLRATAEILKPFFKLRVFGDTPIPASLFFITTFFVGALLPPLGAFFYLFLFVSLFLLFIGEEVVMKISESNSVMTGRPKESKESFHQHYVLTPVFLFLSFFACLGHITATHHGSVESVTSLFELTPINLYYLMLLVYSCYIITELQRMDCPIFIKGFTMKLLALHPLVVVWMGATFIPEDSTLLSMNIYEMFSLIHISIVLAVFSWWGKGRERN